MFPLLLTEEQEMMRINIERMIQEEVIPITKQIEEEDEVPEKIRMIFREMGFQSNRGGIYNGIFSNW